MNNDQQGKTQGTPINTTGTRGYTTNASGDVVVPEYEEQLVAEKVERQEGTVHVHKGVVEEQQTVSAPVTHEEVDVERVPVRNQVGAAPPDAFQETDLNIPLQGEQLVAGKQVVEAEEVHLRKHQVQEEEQVTGTVRREDVEVDQPNQYATGGTVSTARTAPVQTTTETTQTTPTQGTVVSGTTAREAGTSAQSGTTQGTTYRIEAEPVQETTFGQTGGAGTIQSTTPQTDQAGGTVQGAAQQGAQKAQQGAGEAKGKLDSMIDGAADKLLGRDH